MVSCSSRIKDITLNDHFHKSISTTPEIIATQFKEEGIDKVPVVLLNDPRYNNAYLLNDSIYFDFEQVNRILGKLKIASGNRFAFSVIRDMEKIRQVFEKYNAAYSGQDRLIRWESN
jgi:hypothetical protein